MGLFFSNKWWSCICTTSIYRLCLSPSLFLSLLSLFSLSSPSIGGTLIFLPQSKGWPSSFYSVSPGQWRTHVSAGHVWGTAPPLRELLIDFPETHRRLIYIYINMTCTYANSTGFCVCACVCELNWFSRYLCFTKWTLIAFDFFLVSRCVSIVTSHWWRTFHSLRMVFRCFSNRWVSGWGVNGCGCTHYISW